MEARHTGRFVLCDYSHYKRLLWGNLLEPTIRREVASRLGYEYEAITTDPYSIRERDGVPFMRATLDGLLPLPTAAVATRLGRGYVSIDIREAQIEVQRRRLESLSVCSLRKGET